MKVKLVNLRDHQWQPIFDFSRAKNHYLEMLKDDEYVWFISDDEDVSMKTFNAVQNHPGGLPYYAIRFVQYIDGKYAPWFNPSLIPDIVSNRVRFRGKIHEKPFPRKPYGVIESPIIHYHVGRRSYENWHSKPAYRPIMALKKTIEILRGR